MSTTVLSLDIRLHCSILTGRRDPVTWNLSFTIWKMGMRMPTSNKNLERYVYQDACIIPTHICVCVLKKGLLGCPPDIQSTAVTHGAGHLSPICGDSTLILLGSPPLPSLSPCGCYRSVSTRVLVPTESDSLGVEPSYLLASFFQGSEVMLGEGVNPPRKWHIYRGS